MHSETKLFFTLTVCAGSYCGAPHSERARELQEPCAQSRMLRMGRRCMTNAEFTRSALRSLARVFRAGEEAQVRVAVPLGISTASGRLG